MEMLGIVSRRHILLGLGGAAVAGTAQAQGFGNAGFFAQPLETAGYAEWSAQVGSNFSTATGGVLKLVSVEAYGRSGSRPHDVRRTGFAARFEVVGGGELSEGRHIVAHAQKGGAFEVFLTRSGAGKPLGMVADYN